METGTDIDAFWSFPYSRKIQKVMIEGLRRNGLKSAADVLALIEWLRGPRISSRVNCGNPNHRAPLDFVTDILLGRVHDYVVWANRSGGKSYLAALVTWVKSGFLPDYDTTILGGSFEQSEKVYKAMGDFWDSTGLRDDWLTGEPMRRLTEWKNKSRVSVLTASTRSARGPHPVQLIMDEVDEMPEDVYIAALSQPQSKHGHISSLGRLSTNHRVGGAMDLALANAKEHGIPIYHWCIFETSESCRDYSCSTCKLTPFCPGLQMKNAEGHYAIHDFVSKLRDLSLMSLQTDWFCNKVGRSDLVYGEQFDEAIHSPLDLPDFSPDLPAVISIDWGGTNPFSLGVWQKFTPLGWIRVDEIYIANTTNTRLIEEARSRPWWPNVSEGVADPSRPDLIKEWAAAGIKLYAANNDIEIGIGAVRNALRPVLGPPKFRVNRRCQYWLMEVNNYLERKGKPVKEKDHSLDETRYWVMWKLGPVRRGGKVIHGGMKVPEKEVPADQPRPAEGSVVNESEVKAGGNHGQRKQRVFISSR
jgi:hypothetical protein